MSYVNSIVIIQNDYGYDLEFQLTDNEGDAVDLTGATAIKLFVSEPESATAKVAETCTATDAENGLCKYTVQDGDFDEAPENYLAEIEVTYTGKVVTAKGLRIRVDSELPESTS